MSQETAQRVASLVAMGAQSGDTVCGLSGVRRTRALRLLFVAGGVSANTQTELERRSRDGCRLFTLDDLTPLTAPMGRDDVQVLGIKSGSLADGIERKLAG